jgi:hypothetical protein
MKHRPAIAKEAALLMLPILFIGLAAIAVPRLRDLGRAKLILTKLTVTSLPQPKPTAETTRKPSPLGQWRRQVAPPDVRIQANVQYRHYFWQKEPAAIFPARFVLVDARGRQYNLLHRGGPNGAYFSGGYSLKVRSPDAYFELDTDHVPKAAGALTFKFSFRTDGDDELPVSVIVRR